MVQKSILKAKIQLQQLLGQKGNDAGLLLFRLVFGGLMVKLHGWTKWQNFSDWLPEYPDPLGMGKEVSLLLSILMQVVGCWALILGVQTRLVALMLSSTMFIAAFVVKSGSTFLERELALLYAFAYLGLFLTGAGKYTAGHIASIIFKSK